MSLHDLYAEIDMYRRRAKAVRSEAKVARAPRSPGKAPARVAAPARRPLSAPFYATGEHVLSGEVVSGDFNAATDTLDVNGVPFTYAELVAMGDLFETADEMLGASKTELQRLRVLIRAARKHYAARILGGPAGKNATDADWQAATGGRYVRLAKDNFTHFAPTNTALTPGATGSKKHYKQEWEAYHARAVAVARKGTKDDVSKALVVNAFADHFLTDAFSAGHIVSKEDVNTLFRVSVLSGGRISPAGRAFFEKVAAQSFTGPVKDAFSKYETVRDYLGPIKWNPNIHKTSRFEDLLIGIMEVEPDIIGKTAVIGAIHDRLNSMKGGLAVVNGRGTKWQLTGDGTLDKKNLDIMRQAVMQSIRNVQEAASTTETMAALSKKVWDYVPQPAPGSVQTIRDLIHTFTNPARKELVTATAEMITQNYQVFLDELVRRKILKKA